MGCDIHVFVEYKQDGQWRYLGAYHPGRDYRMFSLLANVRGDGPAVVEPRGYPDDCSLEAWLANMGIRTGDDRLSDDQIARLRVARMVGADVDHLVSPCLDWHGHTWLTGAELGRAIKRYGSKERPYIAWKGLQVLLESLPEGRMCVFFDN